jgi:microcystin-dependent protein
MADPYVGEIRMFGGNFAPVGWEFCEGQLLPISEFETLFNLIGTTYGGDGENTFALPDLRGRFPLHQGNNGSSNYIIGQTGGSESATLTANQMPAHNHTAMCASGGGNVASPSGAFWSTDPFGNTAAYNEAGGSSMAASAIGFTGSGLPHENRQPYLAVSFIISLFGIFPSQN